MIFVLSKKTITRECTRSAWRDFAAIHEGVEKLLCTEVFGARCHDWKERYDHYLRKITAPNFGHAYS